MAGEAIIEISECEGGNCGTPRPSAGGGAIPINMEGQPILNVIIDGGFFT